MVVGWFTDLPERMSRALLWTDIECVIVSASHPLAGKRVSRHDLLDYPHVVVELTGSGEPADEGFLEERGVMRRVWVERLLLDTRGEDGAVIGRAAVSVPHYAAVIPMVASTDLIATLPTRYTDEAVKAGSVVRLPLPYEPVQGSLEAIWHHRNDDDRALRWVVEQARIAMGQCPKQA